MRTETGSHRGGVGVELGCWTHRNDAKRGGGNVADELTILASIPLGFLDAGDGGREGGYMGT